MGAGPGDDDAVDQVLDALRAGTGVLLTGAAGSGAGTLAERAAGALAEDGRQVIRVPGRPGVRGRPLAALALAGWAARPAPGDPLGPATARVLEAVGTGRAVLLSRRADLLDEASRAVLATVAEQTGSLPLLTARPARASRVAAVRAAGAVPVTAVAVPPLRFDALLAVLTEVLGGPPAPDAAARVYAPPRASVRRRAPTRRDRPGARGDAVGAARRRADCRARPPAQPRDRRAARRTREFCVATVMVTHDHDVLEHVDRVVEMVDGRLRPA